MALRAWEFRVAGIRLRKEGMKVYWIQSTRTKATLLPNRVWILLLGGEGGRQFEI